MKAEIPERRARARRTSRRPHPAPSGPQASAAPPGPGAGRRRNDIDASSMLPGRHVRNLRKSDVVCQRWANRPDWLLRPVNRWKASSRTADPAMAVSQVDRLKNPCRVWPWNNLRGVGKRWAGSAGLRVAPVASHDPPQLGDPGGSGGGHHERARDGGEEQCHGK